MWCGPYKNCGKKLETETRSLQEENMICQRLLAVLASIILLLAVCDATSIAKRSLFYDTDISEKVRVN